MDLDFHVITSTEHELIMRTRRGKPTLVLPAPLSSRPPATVPGKGSAETPADVPLSVHL